MRHLNSIARMGVAVMLSGVLSLFYGARTHVQLRAATQASITAAAGIDNDRVAHNYSDLFLHFISADRSNAASIHKDNPGTSVPPAFLSGALFALAFTQSYKAEDLGRTAYKQEFTPIQLSALYPFHSFW